MEHATVDITVVVAGLSGTVGTLFALIVAQLRREQQRGDRLEAMLWRLLNVADRSTAVSERLSGGPLA